MTKYIEDRVELRVSFYTVEFRVEDADIEDSIEAKCINGRRARYVESVYLIPDDISDEVYETKSIIHSMN